MKHLQDLDLHMIVATDAGGGIGYEGNLPWPKHAGDFKHFQTVTKGSTVIMGRKTFEEIARINKQRGKIGGPLLPNRNSIVITTKDIENITKEYEFSVEKSLHSAVKYCKEDNTPVFIIGGLQLYTEALPFVNTIHLTLFKEHYKCDRYLPLKYIGQNFKVVEGTQEADLYFVQMKRYM
jgi:dihydrofolate reductase